MPYLRKKRERTRSIEVMADSMRVGKTTAVKVIADGLRARGMIVTESYEDWEHNPYLKNSYADPARNFLESQKWFIRRKWEQIRQAHCEQIKGGGEGIFIQDVSPFMDYNYAETNRRLGRMSEEHFAEYTDYYHSLDWAQAPPPDILIYLTISDKVLLQRAMDSRRDFEEVELEYYLMMKKVNREWLEEARASENKILIIDTDRLNYVTSESDKSRLVAAVAKLF